jgi:hypothetical protein
MSAVNRLWISSGLVLLGFGIGSARAQAQPPPPDRPESPPPLDGPATDLAPLPPTPNAAGESGGIRGERQALQHEALQPSGERGRQPGAEVHVRKEPPAAVEERPSTRRPGLRAQWVPGYWAWDVQRNDFVWIGGMWQVPPPGTFWLAGRWLRDADGWYRVPGLWASRRDRRAAQTDGVPADRPSWQITGPPADHPDDTPGRAPGPDFFFVPGHYLPVGDRLSWKAGFWARMQPDWDWVPARWVRRSDGWGFRPGYWARDPEALAGGADLRRRTTARPMPDDASASPEGDDRPPGSAILGDDLRPPPPLVDDDRDPIARGEDLRRRRDILPDDPAFVGPLTGMPYYVIRPPGAFPYGPGGVVVPGAVPPFVRRILDRVLP